MISKYFLPLCLQINTARTLELRFSIPSNITKELSQYWWTSITNPKGQFSFEVELRLSPRWLGGNIGSTDATKIYDILNAYNFKTNNRKVINNTRTSLDSL
jgi:hypothetical protein